MAKRNSKLPSNPFHPGEVLLEEFLNPGNISQAAFAERLGWTRAKLNELIKGKRGVSAESAWLLSEAFGTSPQFWINLQTNYDLATHRPERHVAKIKRAS